MKIIFALLIAFLFAADAPAQSVVITSKKTTYTRSKPIAEFKKTFTVNYPKVKATTPALSRRIESAISYEKIFDLNVQEEIQDVQWLEEADFTVVYNARGLLCIDLFIAGSGAYPSGITRTLVINSRTGNRVRASDAFVDHVGLTEHVKGQFTAEIDQRIKELRTDPEYAEEDPAHLFENKTFTSAELDEFSIDEKGVTFIYDYGFPHVIQALAPDGRFHFSWREISKFIKRDGPFAQFIVR